MTLEAAKAARICPHFPALHLLHVVAFRIVLVASDMCLLVYECPVCACMLTFGPVGPGLGWYANRLAGLFSGTD